MEPVYIFFGHGCENIGEHFIVPKGYTLVTVEECGTSASAPVPGRVARFLNEHLSIAQRPSYGMSIGGIAARVYKEGDNAPVVRFKPESIIKSLTSPTIRRFGLSGLYKLPLRADDLNVMETLPLMTGTIEDVKQSYRNSLFPTLNDILQRYPERPRHLYVKDTMMQFGPGVYYFPICRVPCAETTASIPLLRQKSKEQQDIGMLTESIQKLKLGGRRRKTHTRKRKTRSNVSSSRRLPSSPRRTGRRSFS